MELQSGMILGGVYQITEEIGSGGGGIVYKARHLRLQTDVVVKKIRDEVRGKIQSRREADVLKKLKHPYLPRVYDFIETPDGVYTVMDYIPGIALDKLLKQYSRVNQKQVLMWARELAEALAYLHSQNPPIIHSDIKPANIILTPQGHICLIDFNISVVFDASMSATLGISVGYSSPEQYLSISRHYVNQSASPIDMRSDVYSLGCVLYHLLAGFPPDTNFNNRIPAANLSGVSEGFAAIIDKMIQYYPQDRYQSGDECLHAVQNCYKLDRRYVKQHRKERMLFTLSLVLFLIGALLIGGGVYRLGREANTEYAEQILQADKKASKGDYEAAINIVTDLEETRKQNVEAYQKELYYLYQQREYEECADRGDEITSLQEITLYNDTDEQLMGDIFYIISNAYYEMENYDDAQTAIEKALEYYTENAYYYRDYCIILAKQGRIEKAQSVLEKAIKRDLDNASIEYADGEICAVQGETDSAIEHFQNAIKTADDAEMKRRAILLCAQAMKDDGRLEDELTFLEQARTQVESADALVIMEYLADAYMSMGDSNPDELEYYNNKALELFRELKSNGYITYQLQENMAILLEENKDFDAAKEQLTQMLADYPDNYKVYKRLAFLEADIQQYIENENRDYTQMKSYYDKAVELYGAQDEQDTEMQMLEVMIQDLASGGWF